METNPPACRQLEMAPKFVLRRRHSPRRGQGAGGSRAETRRVGAPSSDGMGPLPPPAGAPRPHAAAGSPLGRATTITPAAGLDAGTEHGAFPSGSKNPFCFSVGLGVFLVFLLGRVEIPAVAAAVTTVSSTAARGGLTLKEETFLLFI